MPRRLPVRGDPGRDLDRSTQRTERARRTSSSTTRRRRCRSRSRRRPASGSNDFDNSTGQPAQAEQQAAGVLNGRTTSSRRAPDYQRFCSNYLATQEQGFDRADPASRTKRRPTSSSGRATRGPPRLRRPGAEQAGVVVAYDVKTGSTRPSTAWAGTTTRTASRIPGYGKRSCSPATTRSPRRASQLYMYSRASANDVWNDKGTLVGVQVPTTRAINDYGDLTEA